MMPRRLPPLIPTAATNAFVAVALATSGAFLTAAGQAPGVPTQRTIAQALATRETATPVTIAGRATVASGRLQSAVFDIAVQDASGGIRVFSRAPMGAVQEGDSVIASGVVKRYRGNPELVAASVRVVAGPRAVATPQEMPVDPAKIARESGRLVRVRGLVAGFGTSEGGQWLRLRDSYPSAKGTITVWVPANHAASVDLQHVHTEDSLEVTGIVTSYQDNADDPVVWQLVPRDAADVVVARTRSGISRWLLGAGAIAASLVALLLLVVRLGARRQLNELRETETRYRQLLALLPDAVIVHADGVVLFNNAAACELLGVNGDALHGRSVIDFLHLESMFLLLPGAAADAVQTGENTPAPRARARMVRADGSVVDVETTSSPCVYHHRTATVLLARDITAQLRYERDLHALALVDELTGIQNRRAFSLFAEQELARARRHGRTPVLVFADLDGLKQINDTYGHAAGDAAIRLVASALKSILRETDIVARWSGDEFVALMGEGGEAAAQQIAPRLDAAIRAGAPASLPYSVSATIGTSPLDPALPLRDAMERADAMLYAQKKRGRRSVARLTPAGIPVLTERE